MEHEAKMPHHDDRREMGYGTDISLVAMVCTLLRWRRLLVVLPFGILILTGVWRLTRQREYTSVAAFAPQSSQQSSLNNLAAQFGVVVAAGEGSESPQFYSALMQSSSILRPLAEKEYRVASDGSATIAELYDFTRGTPALILDRTVRFLHDHVHVETSAQSSIVRLSVTTRRPELSYGIASSLLEAVSDFNIEARQSRASEERRFLEGRLTEARTELSSAEEALSAYLQQNREFRNSPRMVMESDRLQRDVAWKHQIHTTLAQAYEQARIEEIRAMPVITIIEAPVIPVRPDRRGTVRWAVIGAFVGLLLAISIVTVVELFRGETHGRTASRAELEALWSDALADLSRPWRLVTR